MSVNLVGIVSGNGLAPAGRQAWSDADVSSKNGTTQTNNNNNNTKQTKQKQKKHCRFIVIGLKGVNFNATWIVIQKSSV